MSTSSLAALACTSSGTNSERARMSLALAHSPIIRKHTRTALDNVSHYHYRLGKKVANHLRDRDDGRLDISRLLAAALGRIGTAAPLAAQALAHHPRDCPGVEAALGQRLVHRHDEARLPVDLRHQHDHP